MNSGMSETNRNNTRSKVESKQRKGTSFERAVATIQKMMDPHSKVTTNEIINDRLGNKREFDVVVRGRVGGREVLGVIECRDRNTKVGTPQVEAFVAKARNVNANIVLMVSKKGFTRPAMRLAKHEEIGTLSLLPTDPKEAGFSVGVRWYATVYRWKSLTLQVHFAAATAPIVTFRSEAVRWAGLLVIDWFHKELVTTYCCETQEGIHNLALQFDEPLSLEIEGQVYQVTGLTCQATRVRERKKRWVRLSGDGFYDWEKGQITVPNQGQIVSEATRTDFLDWEAYDGEIPEPEGFLEANVTAFMLHFDPKKDVVDLSVL